MLLKFLLWRDHQKTLSTIVEASAIVASSLSLRQNVVLDGSWTYVNSRLNDDYSRHVRQTHQFIVISALVGAKGILELTAGRDRARIEPFMNISIGCSDCEVYGIVIDERNIRSWGHDDSRRAETVCGHVDGRNLGLGTPTRR